MLGTAETLLSLTKKSFKVEALSQLQQAELTMLSGLPLRAPSHGLAYSCQGWDKSLGGSTQVLTQRLLLSRSGCTAGRWNKSPNVHLRMHHQPRPAEGDSWPREDPGDKGLF